jgi:hypothetical protein
LRRAYRDVKRTSESESYDSASASASASVRAIKEDHTHSNEEVRSQAGLKKKGSEFSDFNVNNLPEKTMRSEFSNFNTNNLPKTTSSYSVLKCKRQDMYARKKDAV